MKNLALILLLPLFLLADNAPTNATPVAEADTTEEEERPYPFWLLPRIWFQHTQFRMQLLAAIQRGDTQGMETISRNALQAVPGDPLWHYNLACALAYRENPLPALDELDKAVHFGFRDAETIEKDQDLVRLHQHPRFKQIVEKTRSLAGVPAPERPIPQTSTVAPGGSVVLNETNLVWNFDTGVYEAHLKLAPASRPVAEMALEYGKSQKEHGPEWPSVVAWLSEGTAAGNTGDLYVNRDAAHSQLNVGDFPHLASALHCANAKSVRADILHPTTFFADFAVFGNASRTYATRNVWRSLGRYSMTEPGIATRMDLLYLNNQFWVFPSVDDFGKPELGDIFPAAAPFQFISHGRSWSDLPFLRAALAASASFRPPTKKAILKQRLMGPTLQWLLRRMQKGIRSDLDYFSPKAHPTAFDASRLDVLRIVETAHELRPEQIPPAAALTLINSSTFPIKYPQPGRDYPDLLTETLMQTTCATAIILRSPEGDRTFLVQAKTFPKPEEDAEFTWHVVHGDASAVKITPPLGDLFNTPERGFAQITINRRFLTNRIDVACFAKRKGTAWGAPSFFSFCPIAQEKRVYRSDGKIASIDYMNPDNVYSDPVTALPRRWKDTYTYAPDGTPLGWTRSFNGKDAASFTPSGDRIVERNADGTPLKVVHVKYIPRQTGDATRPAELTYVDDGEPFTLK